MPYLTSAFAPAGWRLLWFGLLLAVSLGCTFGFACAVPFAGFGAIAAMTLTRRDALLIMLALWLVNQIIGFTVLHYPWDGMTFVWGGILGGSAVLGTSAALLVVSQRKMIASAAASFVAAFVAYEGSLYLVSIPLGASEDFTAATVVRIAEINLAAFAALFAAALLAAVYAHAGSPAGTTAAIPSR
jgi:hypothetical protein